MTWINSLTPLQWVLLLTVPPAIFSLYFLKLKRQPVEVPSTYLWSRTIEDLHVNSIWQRLRQNLLLLLQLLFVALAILAALRPGWRGTELLGTRFIFLIDNSASMNATDVAPTRLEFAKQRVNELINQMRSGDVAMVISFSDEARIEQPFTGVRSTLRQKVARIQPTQRRTNVQEALRAAAGLANPGRTSEAGNLNDIQVADALPATLYVFSDGGFSNVQDFSPGNLQPIYVKVGSDLPANVGIVSFSAERNAEKPTQTQAFLRLENCGTAAIPSEVLLYLNNTLLDAAQVDLPAADDQGPGTAGVEFEFADPGEGVLRVELSQQDQLLDDNAAHAVLNPPRHARVLVVTPGNESLQFALATDAAQELAEVQFAGVEILQQRDYQEAALAAQYDLILFDRCVPEAMPSANTFFIGNVPKLEGWKKGPTTSLPVIVDTDPLHPLTQLVQMADVKWNFEGFPIQAPAGADTLIDADIGPLMVIAQRDGFEDLVLGMELVGSFADGTVGPKTEWPVRRSFPVFMMNLLRYLGGVRAGDLTSQVIPGAPIELRSMLPVDQLQVTRPDGTTVAIQRESTDTFLFTRTDQLGLYPVREGDAKDVTQQFAVNLFDPRESDLRPMPEIGLGYEQIQAQAVSQATRKEAWKWLLLTALLLLVGEWYIYNRRVYL
jgi:hypothetical protein